MGTATIETKDGTRIFYKDWGIGQPVVFSHGWPLNADAWDDQLLFAGWNGYRAIAHDRRGHGRSSQTWDGNNLDTYADDPIQVFDQLREGVRSDRSQFYKDLSAPFYGANRAGSKVSEGVRDMVWLWAMQVGIKPAYDCI